MRKPFSPTKADLEKSAQVAAAMARQAAEREAAARLAAEPVPDKATAWIIKRLREEDYR